MKKLITSIFLIALILLLAISVYATENSQETEFSLDPTMEAVLKNQLSSDEYEILNNKELYLETDKILKNFSLQEKAVLKIYTNLYWERSNDSLNNILDYANSRKSVIDYVVFDSENIRLRRWENESEISIFSVDEKIAASPSSNYIMDIKAMGANTEILGQQCEINNIYCFEGFASHLGAVVYYCTNKGIFVKYYENELSNHGVWFTEQDFKIYADGYYKYLISPENNYDEKGNPIGGGRIPFLSYIESVENNQTQNNVDNLYEETDYRKIIIVSTSVAIIGVGALGVVYVMRKRKKS